jgi:hypothetical protein
MGDSADRRQPAPEAGEAQAMRQPTILVGLGSGREGWLSIDLASLRFRLEIERDKGIVEILSLEEVKTQLPNITGLVADILAAAVRTNTG